MKLLRYGAIGHEKPGILDESGRIRCLSAHIADLTCESISPEQLDRLRQLDMERLPLVDGLPRLGQPVAGIRQYIGIGMNYKKHVEETGANMPREPAVFNKAITCLSGPDDDIILPPNSECTDWEVELGVIIGKLAKRVSPDTALRYVAGYCIANDVSERDWQFNHDGQWTKGKSFDTFGPVGPWLVTADEVPDPQNLQLRLCVNGVEMQNSSTADMIFSVSEIVAYVSSFMTLLPGDIISTGTPQGVAFGMSPPKYLKKGDVIDLDVTGLGSQRQRVV